MGDENPIRTFGDYSKPSHEGYRNTIELPVGNNVVPLRSDTIWTAKLRNDILMFQQHHGESLSEAWTRFKDLLQKVPHHGIDLWLQVQFFYDHVNPVTRRTIDQSAGGKLRDLNAEESWALLQDLALYDNESWNDPRDFAKPVKAIALPQDVPMVPTTLSIAWKTPNKPLLNTYPRVPMKRKSTTQRYCQEPKTEYLSNLSARSYQTKDPQCSTHGSINAITIHPKQPNELRNDESKEKEHGKEGSPKDTNTMVHNDEQRDTSQLEPKVTSWISPSRKNIKTNIDPSLSNVVFGRPFVEIPCLAINRKYGLMTFTDGIKEITFKAPYKDPERSELSSEGHDLSSSRVILSEDDYDRGCRRPSNLEDGFYRDTIKLGPEYLTGIDYEGEVT
ncbi:hypothetical protein Tco_0355946 [Tanacetum coccineum]